MANRIPLVPGEWYHCFNRGVDKRRVFLSDSDYERFLALMYVCNGELNNQVSDRRDTRLLFVLNDEALERGKPLVEIGAYALMPNHPHFVFREIREGGIALFMQKLFTGYTMYFNKKHARTGALFSGAFKSKHIHDDIYLKRVLAYVLLNPAELFEPKWKKGIADAHVLGEKLFSYPHASTADFFGKKRLQSKIANFPTAEFYDRTPTLQEVIKDARAYYAEIHMRVGR